MRHTLVSAKLLKPAEHWKDKMVGYHLWKIVTKCPLNDKQLIEKVHGCKDEAIESCVAHPDCSCQE